MLKSGKDEASWGIHLRFNSTAAGILVWCATAILKTSTTFECLIKSLATMNTPVQIAKHFRDVHFGGNWTCVNLKDSLSDVTREEAITKVHNLNTILALAYHINYYVSAVLKVLQGGELDAHDKYSYAHPEINSQSDWEALLNKLWTEAEAFATLVEQLPEEKLSAFFSQEKYGTYYRNLHGIIEHSHYHLGQIVVIKKMLREGR